MRRSINVVKRLESLGKEIGGRRWDEKKKNLKKLLGRKGQENCPGILKVLGRKKMVKKKRGSREETECRIRETH